MAAALRCRSRGWYCRSRCELLRPRFEPSLQTLRHSVLNVRKSKVIAIQILRWCEYEGHERSHRRKLAGLNSTHEHGVGLPEIQHHFPGALPPEQPQLRVELRLIDIESDGSFCPQSFGFLDPLLKVFDDVRRRARHSQSESLPPSSDFSTPVRRSRLRGSVLPWSRAELLGLRTGTLVQVPIPTRSIPHSTLPRREPAAPAHGATVLHPLWHAGAYVGPPRLRFPPGRHWHIVREASGASCPAPIIQPSVISPSNP